MAATNAVYNFWLYELCDVYIEAMKPMADPSASASTRLSAQNTLYTCLDHGLRLLHPSSPHPSSPRTYQRPAIPRLLGFRLPRSTVPAPCILLPCLPRRTNTPCGAWHGTLASPTLQSPFARVQHLIRD